MKFPHRRQLLHLAAGVAALPAVSRIAWAQAYPSRPIHWIVSFAAGGPNDTVARIVGQFLSEKLGQQVIVENRVGAGGNIGMGAVLSSPPDGYTLGFVAPNNAINATLYEKLPFDFIRDSAPIGGSKSPALFSRTVAGGFMPKYRISAVQLSISSSGTIRLVCGAHSGPPSPSTSHRSAAASMISAGASAKARSSSSVRIVGAAPDKHILSFIKGAHLHRVLEILEKPSDHGVDGFGAA